MRGNLVSVRKFHFEYRVGKRFEDDALNFDKIGFGHL